MTSPKVKLNLSEAVGVMHAFLAYMLLTVKLKRRLALLAAERGHLDSPPGVLHAQGDGF